MTGDYSVTDHADNTDALRIASEEVVQYNQVAWNEQVRIGNRWTIPVSSEQVHAARHGNLKIDLTPNKAVPRDWFGNLANARVLCLAGGGGQQGPLLAAAGASVTVVDQSANQLGQDRLVAKREGLQINTVQCDMRNLETFADDSFDIVVNPCSNSFVPDIRPIWRETFRVLRTGGRLMSGWIQPHVFLFEMNDLAAGRTEVRYRLPYSDQEQLSAEQLKKFRAENEPLWFGHTLSDQIGSQLDAGFLLKDMYEDIWSEPPWSLLDDRIASFAATLAIKP